MHLADAFIQSDLHCIQVSTFYQLLLSLGIEPMILALLAPCSTSWATGKLSAHLRPNSSCYTVNSTYYEGDGLKKVKNHMTMVGCLTEDILIKRVNVIPVNGVF